MTDTTAKIRAKSLEATGITEEIASQLFHSVGRHFMAIVEVKVAEPHGPNTEGKRRVDLTIEQVEPAMDDQLDAHLRELTRTLYYNRKVDEHGPTLDGPGDDIEPDLKTVLSAGQRYEPHPYLASTLSTDDTPVCDVCGQHEGATVHADRDQLPDPFTAPTDDEEAEAEAQVIEEDPEDDLEDETEDQAEAADEGTHLQPVT